VFLQVALGSLICAAMVCVSVGLRPFMDVSHNNLSLVCLVHLSFTLYVGLLLKVNTVQPGPLLTVLTSLIIAISIWIIVGACVSPAALAVGLPCCVCTAPHRMSNRESGSRAYFSMTGRKPEPATRCRPGSTVTVPSSTAAAISCGRV